jgi:hypothetical protein
MYQACPLFKDGLTRDDLNQIINSLPPGSLLKGFEFVQGKNSIKLIFEHENQSYIDGETYQLRKVAKFELYRQGIK